jgi:acyl-coenzyme A thioesterase PaaI-like protein
VGDRHPDAPLAEGSAPPEPSAPAALSDLLRTRPRAADASALLTLAVSADLANPLGNLHGGITLVVSDLVAQAAFAAAGWPTRTTSVHVACPRPMPLGMTVRFQAR